jgi:hypothetical protein
MWGRIEVDVFILIIIIEVNLSLKRSFRIARVSPLWNRPERHLGTRRTAVSPSTEVWCSYALHRVSREVKQWLRITYERVDNSL